MHRSKRTFLIKFRFFNESLEKRNWEVEKLTGVIKVLESRIHKKFGIDDDSKVSLSLTHDWEENVLKYYCYCFFCLENI